MGYFSNGDEGEGYAARWCARCPHDRRPGGCPIMAAHYAFNYSEHGKAGGDILDMLIPRHRRWGDNLRCRFYAGPPDRDRGDARQLGLGLDEPEVAAAPAELAAWREDLADADRELRW